MGATAGSGKDCNHVLLSLKKTFDVRGGKTMCADRKTKIATAANKRRMSYMMT